METRKIFLIRHGRILTPDNDKRYIGQIDLPLDEEGVRQAVCLRERLTSENISAIYCSDLLRTYRTAEIIVADRNITTIALKDLREISMGEWEGCTFTDIERRFPGAFKARGEDIAYYRVAGGESFAECSQRVTTVFDDILRSSAGDIIIVGHAGVNRLILCHLLGISISNLFSLRQDFGCLNTISYTNSGCKVQINE